MTEIITPGPVNRRKGRLRMKKGCVKIDMTPMVDLGFLLITFFVVTAEMNKPSVVNLNMPKEGPSTPVGNSTALSVLLADHNRVYYYYGNWEEAVANDQVLETNLSVYSGLGQVIRQRQKWMDLNNPKGRDALVLIIKGSKGANYNTVINSLDEAIINQVNRSVLVSADASEQPWLSARSKNK